MVKSPEERAAEIAEKLSLSRSTTDRGGLPARKHVQAAV